MAIRRVPTDELSANELAELDRMVRAAFSDYPEGFSDEDWDHALGGVHFILEEDGVVAAHASVVERELHAGDHHLVAGYVEAVGTRKDSWGRGYGSVVMREVGEYIDKNFSLGALDTGVNAFYERLGWVTWKGPTFVRTESGPVRTEEDDGSVMVRLTPASPELDLTAPISCEWRSGDVW